MVAIGCVIKTPGSSKNNKTGSWRTFKPILDKEKCIDCDNCIIFCPDSSVNKQHDTNIVIRTALHKNGKYHLGVGGGITAESDLEFEYEETLQKAKAILDALQ